MKRIYFLFLMIISYSSLKAGCDMCNMYVGLNPNYNKNTIGLRYRYSSYSDLGMIHTNASGNYNSNNSGKLNYRSYRTTELWAMYYPTPKVQLLFAIPYMDNRLVIEDNLKQQVLGLGDLTLLGRYQILNRNIDSIHNKQRLFIGFGIKAPTGQYQDLDYGGMLDPHIQPGTGSLDYLLSLGYFLKSPSDYGFNIDLNYKITNTNPNEYRFANRLNSNMHLFYQYHFKDHVIMPSIGSAIEFASLDINQKIKQLASNGTIINGVLELDYFYHQYAIIMSVQSPVYSHFNDSNAKHQGRLMVGINYSF